MQLQAGYQNWICWQYQNAQKSSPNLLFQLDVDMSKGSAWTTYAIARVQAAVPSCDAVGVEGQYNVTTGPIPTTASSRSRSATELPNYLPLFGIRERRRRDQVAGIGAS